MIDQQKIIDIRENLSDLRDHLKDVENDHTDLLAKVDPRYKKSAANLLHFIALSRKDTSLVQQDLEKLGICSLNTARDHVMGNLQAVLAVINKMQSSEFIPENDHLDLAQADQAKKNNTTALFGSYPRERDVHIMVTMPSDASTNYQLVKKMVSSGMNIARINCAKDTPKDWLKMIQFIKKAEKETGLPCKIQMDLAGPKIRTGPVKLGPQIIEIQPQRNIKGQVVQNESIYFKLSEQDENDPDQSIIIPIEGSIESGFSKMKYISLYDTRNHHRLLRVEKVNENGILAFLDHSAYIKGGMKLELLDEDKKPLDVLHVGSIKRKSRFPILSEGDDLFLHAEQTHGEPALIDNQGNVKKAAHISCTLPEVFRYLQEGEAVLFDDGKIAGEIMEKKDDELKIKINYVKNQSRPLKAEKGINFPDSKLDIPVPTEKDLDDLKLVSRYADIVNLSFVKNEKDIRRFLNELQHCDRKPGVMLKIETQQSVQNLPWLLLTAMQTYPVGIMIARGDLAVECGWVKMARYQQEIRWLCEAAHIPNVWATQVLEGMAKKGLPKRAELTDAARSQKSDCVMLNKGPYIVDTIEMLVNILQSVKGQEEKRSIILEEMEMN